MACLQKHYRSITQQLWRVNTAAERKRKERNWKVNWDYLAYTFFFPSYFFAKSLCFDGTLRLAALKSMILPSWRTTLFMVVLVSCLTRGCKARLYIANRSGQIVSCLQMTLLSCSHYAVWLAWNQDRCFCGMFAWLKVSTLKYKHGLVCLAFCLSAHLLFNLKIVLCQSSTLFISLQSKLE